MSEDLDRVFNDDGLPLPARLDAAREAIRELTDAVAILRQRSRDMVAAADLNDDLRATLYWEYDDLIPSAQLGQYHQLREMLEERCPWTYPCPSCGKDQRITSRTALKDLLRGATRRAPDRPTCRECRDRAAELNSARYAEQEQRYRQRLRELKTMSYRDYLQTPEWKERRAARLKAARYSCQVCNARNITLNVHHRTYVRRGEEFARDLIVLCEGCHKLFHRNGSLAPHDRGED